MKGFWHAILKVGGNSKMNKLLISWPSAPFIASSEALEPGHYQSCSVLTFQAVVSVPHSGESFWMSIPRESHIARATSSVITQASFCLHLNKKALTGLTNKWLQDKIMFHNIWWNALSAPHGWLWRQESSLGMKKYMNWLTLSIVILISLCWNLKNE